MTKLAITFLSSVLLTMVCSSPCVAQYYTFTDLGSLGGGQSAAYAINDNGQITGMSYDSANEGHVFLYENGFMQDVGTLGGTFGEGLAINSSGKITGDSVNADGQTHAFLYNGSMIDLGTLNSRSRTTESYGYGINDSDVVVGWSGAVGAFDPLMGGKGFIYSGGAMKQILNLPGFNNSYARAINHSGQVVGGELNIQSGSILAQHPFLSQGATLNDLGTTPLGQSVDVLAVNENGVIAGTDGRNNDGSFYAVVYVNGTFKKLAGPSGYFSDARSINNLGYVVGSLQDSHWNNDPVPMYYNSLIGMINLNTQVFNSSGIVPEYAYGINNHGQIVGIGFPANSDSEHAFLLDPIHIRMAGKYIEVLAGTIRQCDVCRSDLTRIALSLPSQTKDLSTIQRNHAITALNTAESLVSRYAEAGLVTKANALVVTNEAKESLAELKSARHTSGTN